MAVLELTDSAVEILKEARDEIGAPKAAGARLTGVRTDQGDTIRIEFADAPEQGDQVIEEAGLRVFVSDELVETLTDRTLDVTDTASGRKLAIR